MVFEDHYVPYRVIFRAAKIIIIWKLWQALGDGAGSEVDGEAERAIGM
jgi:hypothetical protein